MSGVRSTLIGALSHGLAIALGLSAAFLLLLLTTSPVVATSVALTASLGVGLLRARLLPMATPHSLTPLNFEPRAVTNAPKAATFVSGDSASSAA